MWYIAVAVLARLGAPLKEKGISICPAGFLRNYRSPRILLIALMKENCCMNSKFVVAFFIFFQIVPSALFASDAANLTGKMAKGTTSTGKSVIYGFHGSSPDSLYKWEPYCTPGCYFTLGSATPTYLPVGDLTGLAFSADGVYTSTWEIGALYQSGSSGSYANVDVCDGVTCANKWWSTGYDSNQTRWRVVEGDFVGDSKPDLAAFYDYGSCVTRIHVWENQSGSYVYTGGSGWWYSTGYCVSAINGRVVSGNFNNSGKEDIAVLYDYGGTSSRIHVFTNTGTSFTYSGNAGWWSNTGYAASAVGARLVSGNFDNDGVRDDIAALYANGSTTLLSVWKSTGSAFTYQGTVWSGSYDATKVNGRVVAGDYNLNTSGQPLDTCTDIAALFDNGTSSTMHVWKSDCSVYGTFSYQGANGWWQGN